MPISSFVQRFAGGLLLCLMAHSAAAQDRPAVDTGGADVRVTLGGALQPRLSYGWTTNTPSGAEAERIGFGIRRARVRMRVTVGPRAGAFVRADGGSGDFRAVDAYLFYTVGDRLEMRLGRMKSAQPASSLFSYIRLDDVDFPAIALTWRQTTLGPDGRDFGFEFRYRAARGEAILFVHTGDGSWDRLRGNYREGVTASDPTGGVARTPDRLAVSFYSAFRPLPDVDVGGFASYNGSENPNTEADGRGRAYVSYAAHLYWGAMPGSQPVRLKADALGTRYEKLSDAPLDVREQHAVGLALLGAVRVHRAAEVYARFEQYDANLDRGGRGEVYAAGGVNLSLSALRGRPFHQERLTLGYQGGFPEDDDAPRRHLVVLQAQIAF